jgi:hypothetical protein
MDKEHNEAPEVNPKSSQNVAETNMTAKAKEEADAAAEVEAQAGPEPGAEAKAGVRREKGCCMVAKCGHPEMELLHKCLTRNKYIHIICAIDNKLQGKDECFYCSLPCTQRDTTPGSTGQDSLHEKNPATDERANAVNPTTPEFNLKLSEIDAEADARLEYLSKALNTTEATDPVTLDDVDLTQNMIEDLKQNIEVRADSINADP